MFLICFTWSLWCGHIAHSLILSATDYAANSTDQSAENAAIKSRLGPTVQDTPLKPGPRHWSTADRWPGVSVSERPHQWKQYGSCFRILLLRAFRTYLRDNETQRERYDDDTKHDFCKRFLPSQLLLSSTVFQRHLTLDREAPQIKRSTLNRPSKTQKDIRNCPRASIIIIIRTLFISVSHSPQNDTHSKVLVTLCLPPPTARCPLHPCTTMKSNKPKNIFQFHADGRTEGPYPVTMEVTYPHVLPEVTI